jgi:predicted transcriptional regulator
MVKKENFVTIQGWMITDLGLKGNELIIYALIYGFSQDEKSEFTGSLNYLAEWTNSTKQGVMKNLKSLVSKGYISKHEENLNGIKVCRYATKFNGGKQSLMGYETKFNGGGKQSLPNNIVYNIDNIEKEKKPYGEFKNVKLTDREYEKLKEIYGSQLDDGISCLSEYIESSGKKYKSHYATMGKSQWVYKKVKQNNYQTSPIKSNVIAIQGEYNAYR